MTKKQRQAIEKHGQNLQTIFTAAKDLDPVKLCKKLRRIEDKAHKLTERECNIGMPEAYAAAAYDRILDDLNALLHWRKSHIPVFINGDPRGYALKIQDTWMEAHPELYLHKDWGGYGIIAPEIDAEGN